MFYSFKKQALVASAMSGLFLLAGCGSSSSDNGAIGYIQLYNASANAPAIYLTVDEDLNDEDEDAFEHTYSPISFGEVSGLVELENGDYYVEFAWQDEDSTARDDLEMIYQQATDIQPDIIKLYAITEDITSPNILTFDIALIDDETDTENDLFNLRFLNLHASFGEVDVYMSNSSETFNEAKLVSTRSYAVLSDNEKFEQDDYKFYLTAAGSSEVVFESEEISFPYSSQYIMSLRENLGADETPFVIDVVSKSNIVEYQQEGASASFRAFNGIKVNDLLDNYTGAFDLYMNTANPEADVTNLQFGEFSQSINTEHGDYSFAITVPSTDEQLLKNHLVTLNENANKTIFFYTSELYVDHDGDGDVDEDGDGQVDEIELKVNSLVVDNNTAQSIYEHNINIVNLIDDKDFSSVTVYFVRSDELIETANNRKTVAFSNSGSLNLMNNTYEVFVVAQINSSDVILTSQSLLLDEDSQAMFLVLELDESSPTGYKMTFNAQLESETQ